MSARSHRSRLLSKKKLWCSGVKRCQRLPETRAAERADVAGRQREDAAGPQILVRFLEVASRVDGVLDVVPHRDCVERRRRDLGLGEAHALDGHAELGARPLHHRDRDVDAGSVPAGSSRLVDEEAARTADVEEPASARRLRRQQAVGAAARSSGAALRRGGSRRTRDGSRAPAGRGSSPRRRSRLSSSSPGGSARNTSPHDGHRTMSYPSLRQASAVVGSTGALQRTHVLNVLARLVGRRGDQTSRRASPDRRRRLGGDAPRRRCARDTRRECR